MARVVSGIFHAAFVFDLALDDFKEQVSRRRLPGNLDTIPVQMMSFFFADLVMFNKYEAIHIEYCK